MKHMDWGRYFRALLSRNVIFCFLINVVNNYGNGMKNAVRTMIGMNNAGMDATMIGVALSMFTIAALVVRSPSGAVVDRFRGKLKQILAGYMLVRATIWLGFMFVSNPSTYHIVFFLDGVINAFIQTALPALLAVSVDRSAMGSAYAIYTGMSTVLTGTARPTALALYESHGRVTVMLVTCAFALLAGALCMCLDSKAMRPVSPKAAQSAKPKAKGFLGLYGGGIHLGLLPLCLVSAVPVIAFTAQSSYSQVWLQDAGFSYMGIDAIGGTLSGIIVIAVGFLCDFVNPAILSIITLAGYTIFPFMMSSAETQTVYSIALWIFYLTKFYHIPLRIVGMKCVTKSEQGAFSSTALFAYDIIAVIGSPILGALMNALGFQGGMFWVGVFGAVGLVSYIVMELTLLPKIRARSKEIEAMEAAEAAAAKAEA